MDPELFCKNNRSARRGAAPGPSGMSVEHILGLVESDHEMEIFCSFATIEAERIAETKLLEEGRARLFRLEQALSAPVGNVADVTMVAPDTEVELARLRAQLAKFQDNVVTERLRVRQRVGGGGPVLPMPTLVPAELSEWMVDRQAELQEAMNAGDNVRLTVTSKLSEAAKHMCELTGSAS